MAEFSQELFDQICERIADGESLRAICNDEGMPSKASMMRWLAADPLLSDQYARAREMQADALFDEMLDIADNAQNDWMERKAEKGSGYELNGEHIQRSRLRLDARKWMAGKLRPKVYGDKLELAVTKPPTEEELDAAIAAKLAALAEGGQG